MIYLHLGLARAACESEATAQRREAQGYVRCSAAVHRALWAIEDATRRAELAIEDAREVVQASEPVPIAAPPPNVVYASLRRFRPGGI